MNIKKIALLIIVAMLVIASGVWLTNYRTNFPAPAKRGLDDFSNVLLRDNSELFTSENQPIFDVKNIEKPQDNWYILTLAVKEKTNDVESRVVIYDPFFGKEYMDVVVGPKTTYSQQELKEAAVPNTTIQAIMKNTRK